jgi:hypothetical protein
VIEGSCLCGDVRYRVDGPVFRMGHCHCSMCRKAHGAAFGTYVNARAEHFSFVRGEDRLGRYASSPGAVRTFCTRCGATLQWIADAPGAPIGIAAGTLDDDPGIRPEFHIFVGSKAPWCELPEDGLPRHVASDRD